MDQHSYDHAGDDREHHGHQHGGHVHTHSHDHVPKDFGSMFAIAAALNLGLVAVQIFYGVAAFRGASG